MRQKRFVVTYLKETKTKDKIFKKEEEARAFYEKNVKYGNRAILSRVTHVTFLENLMATRLHWMGLSINLFAISVILVIFITLVARRGN